MTILPPLMSETELALFVQCLKGVRVYYEFGVGGSTVFAWNECLLQAITPEVYGVDTSAEWIKQVTDLLSSPTIQLKHVDVGALKDFGYPASSAPNKGWVEYSTSITHAPHPHRIDLVLVDGRFRVACFIQSVLTCSVGTKILVHDYSRRPSYRVMENWANRITSAASLTLFETRELFDDERSQLEVAWSTKYWSDTD